MKTMRPGSDAVRLGLFSNHAVRPPSSPGMPDHKHKRGSLPGLLAPLWLSVRGELGDCQEANALGLLASLAATSKACAQERWLRAPPGGGRSRCMGRSQEAEKMGHSSEQCQGLSAGTGRGNRARGCGKQRHTATYVCSQWARDKAAKEREAARRPGPSHYLRQRLPWASSLAGHPKRARDARVGLGARGCPDTSVRITGVRLEAGQASGFGW